MKFYAYRGVYQLGKEPLGTEGKLLFELKTVKGAIRRYGAFLGGNHENV